MERLQFDVDDDRGFERAREALLQAHGERLGGQATEADEWVPQQLLDYKRGYLDGHLGRWRVADLDELFLHIFPRKVIIDADDLPHVVPATRRFLQFLDGEGLLAPGSDPLPRLLTALEGLSEPLRAAMDDTSSFGLAKSLVSAMARDDVDLTDRSAVDTWVQEFNARPYEQREAMMPSAGRLVLPPMALPPEEELAVQALATPAMVQVVAFVEWIGAGRPLTQRGNLKLADGKELVGMLGTRDRFDQTIGDRTFRTASTTELPAVDLVFRLAIKARLARKHHGTVRPTRRGAGVTSDGLEAWRSTVLAMLEIGLIGAGREDRYGLRWGQEYFEEGVVELLSMLAITGEPAPMALLVEEGAEGLTDAYDLDRMPERIRASVSNQASWAVTALVERLVWLGILTWEGSTIEPDELGIESRAGGEVALTGLGRWFSRPLLIAQGIDVQEPGQLADAPVAKLLAAIQHWPDEAVNAEVRLWAATRGSAVDELATYARAEPSPDRLALVLCAMQALGPSAEPAVRGLLDDPKLRPLAAVWLVDQGFEDPDFVAPQDSPAAFVQALAVILVTDGPDAVPDLFATGADVDQQVEVLGHLWRVDDPYTEAVLQAMTAAPNKRIAKAASKSLFRYRSVQR